MARRRGLDYEIITEDKFSITIDRFVKKINLAKVAWVSFRREATKTGTSGVAGGVREVSRKMRDVATETNKANVHIIRLARNLRRGAVAAKSLAADIRSISTKANRVVAAVTKIPKPLKEAGFFANLLNTRFGRMLVILGRITAVFALFRGVGAIFGLIGAAIREAIGFSSKIEDSKLGIQALVASVYEIADASGTVVKGAEKFKLAFKFAEEQVRKLRIEGLKTSATFDQLLDTFQVAIAPGAQAGLPLDEIRKLAVSISQAAQAIGLPQNQLAEEIRSLLQGTISKKNTRIATGLGITNKDIENAKEIGNLFEFLTGQFEQFGVASTAALANFTTRLSNLKDAVGQTLSEGLSGSFIGLKDLIDDAKDSLIDIEKLEISAPALELLQVFDDLGKEIFSALSGLAQNIDFDQVAITFQAVADSVRIFVATLSLAADVLTPFVEIFSLLFSTVVAIARALEDQIAALTIASFIVASMLKIWIAMKLIRFTLIALGSKALKSLVSRLGLLKLIKREWILITGAATAATAAGAGGAVAAGAGVGASIATGAVVAGAAVALPAVIAGITILAVLALVFGKDIRKAFNNLIKGADDSKDALTGMSDEMIATIVLIDDAVNVANKAMETLEKRFDSVKAKAEAAEFTAGFTGVARRAAAVIAAVRVEFQNQLKGLAAPAEKLRTRLAEIKVLTAALDVKFPDDPGATLLGQVNAYGSLLIKLDDILVKLNEAKKIGDFLEQAKQAEELDRTVKALTALNDILRSAGVSGINNLGEYIKLTREAVIETGKLFEVEEAQETLRATLVADTTQKLRVLNASLLEESRIRALALIQERGLVLSLLDAETSRANLQSQTVGGGISGKLQRLQEEFNFEREALDAQIRQLEKVRKTDEDIEEIQKTLGFLQHARADLEAKFASIMINDVLGAVVKVNKEMIKLRETSGEAVIAFVRGLQQIGTDESLEGIDAVIAKQDTLFREMEADLVSMQAALTKTAPLFRELGVGPGIDQLLASIEDRIGALPELIARAKAGLVGQLVTDDIRDLDKTINNLLNNAAVNLQEIQDLVGTEGVGRDIATISIRIRQQFAELRNGLETVQTRIIELSGAAADSGQLIVAGIFGAMASAIDEQVKRLNEGELKVLRDEVLAFSLDLADALSVENRGLSGQIKVQKELNRIEREGFESREESSVTTLKLQQARVELELEFALAESQRQTDGLKAQAAFLKLMGFEIEIKIALLALDIERAKLTDLAAEALRKLEELLARQRLRLEDPAKFFFEDMPTKAEVTADRTIEALGAVRDFLIDDLSGALTDALFRDEDTLKERFQKLAESLVQIMLKEFLQNKVFANILTFGGGGSTGGGGDGGAGWFGGMASSFAGKARATLAHYMGGVHSYAGGGPVGSPSGPTPIGGSGANIRPPKGIDPRDTIPAWLAPREFVMPVAAVNQYGLAVMEAMRSGRLSSSVMNALIGSTKTASRARKYGGSSLSFAHGGSVPGGVSGRNTGGVTILNATNQRDIYDAITTAEGREVVLNVVRFGRDNGLV